MSSTKIPVAKPLLPTARQIVPYLERIDANRWYTNFGTLCLELEQRIADRFGLPAQSVVTLANATVGLTLALQTARAHPGTHCLVPSWTFPASVHAVVAAGLTPYFVDVDEDGLLTPEIARRALAESQVKIGAAMPVAVYGQPIDARLWDAFAIETDLPIVIDAAPGFDSLTPGRTISVVSLHATKILGAGEGAFAVSTDADSIAEVMQRSVFGFIGTREARLIATNAKISEYTAAVGLAGFDQWQRSRADFKLVADRYEARLVPTPGVDLLAGFGRTWLAATCIVSLVEDATPLARALNDAGVETRAWWGEGMHLNEAFASYPRTVLPMTEKLSRRTLGLPFFRDMGPDQVDFVCEVIAQALKNLPGVSTPTGLPLARSA